MLCFRLQLYMFVHHHHICACKARASFMKGNKSVIHPRNNNKNNTYRIVHCTYTSTLKKKCKNNRSSIISQWCSFDSLKYSRLLLFPHFFLAQIRILTFCVIFNSIPFSFSPYSHNTLYISRC